jgi:hypothetical protein
MDGLPVLGSSPYNPNRVCCEFFPLSADRVLVGTSFPRCLMENTIDDFCTVTQDTWMNNTYPMSSNNRGGRWIMYKFTGYAISSLYVGVEISKQRECDNHQRALYAYNNTPGRLCKEQLLGQVVDRCTSLIGHSLFGHRISHWQSHQAKLTVLTSSLAELPQTLARVSSV